MSSAAIHHNDSPEWVSPKQLLTWWVALLGIAWGIYWLTPATEMERVNLWAVATEIKVGDKVWKIILWNWAYCYVDDRWNYTLTIPSPSTVELGGEKTQVNMNTGGMIMWKGLAGTLVTLGVWKNSNEVCASQTMVALNQILNSVVKKN